MSDTLHQQDTNAWREKYPKSFADVEGILSRHWDIENVTDYASYVPAILRELEKPNCEQHDVINCLMEMTNYADPKVDAEAANETAEDTGALIYELYTPHVYKYDAHRLS